MAGLSVGGYGTLVHGLNHPERYAAIGALSASTKYWRRGDMRPGGVVGADGTAVGFQPRFEPYDLARKIADEGRSFPKIYMACGGQDPYMERDLEFRDLLISLGADVTWDEIEQYGHEWRFWNIEIERFLDWLPRTDTYATKGKRKI